MRFASQLTPLTLRPAKDVAAFDDDLDEAPPPDAASKARAIYVAGLRRRGEHVSQADQKFFDAYMQGGRRRNEISEQPSADVKARAIVLVGRRRRGEPLTAEEADWLDRFAVRYGQA
jgi:hypothetical protein